MTQHLLQAYEELQLPDAHVTIDGAELGPCTVHYTWTAPIRVAKDGIYSQSGVGKTVVKLPREILCAVARQQLQARPVVIVANNGTARLHVAGAVIADPDGDNIQFMADSRTKPFVSAQRGL